MHRSRAICFNLRLRDLRPLQIGKAGATLVQRTNILFTLYSNSVIYTLQAATLRKSERRINTVARDGVALD